MLRLVNKTNDNMVDLNFNISIYILELIVANLKTKNSQHQINKGTQAYENVFVRKVFVKKKGLKIRNM